MQLVGKLTNDVVMSGLLRGYWLNLKTAILKMSAVEGKARTINGSQRMLGTQHFAMPHDCHRSRQK
jgi:hypothetical protein